MDKTIPSSIEPTLEGCMNIMNNIQTKNLGQSQSYIFPYFTGNMNELQISIDSNNFKAPIEYTIEVKNEGRGFVAVPNFLNLRKDGFVFEYRDQSIITTLPRLDHIPKLQSNKIRIIQSDEDTFSIYSEQITAESSLKALDELRPIISINDYLDLSNDDLLQTNIENMVFDRLIPIVKPFNFDGGCSISREEAKIKTTKISVEGLFSGIIIIPNEDNFLNGKSLFFEFKDGELVYSIPFIGLSMPRGKLIKLVHKSDGSVKVKCIIGTNGKPYDWPIFKELLPAESFYL